MHDIERPWDRPDLRAAAHAILDALESRRRIAIYGDYDVDGITATAILWHAIRALAPDAEIRTYVPHRIDEGYGLNVDALRALASEGIDLVITVDCGVTAVDEAEHARALGVELVITDHHRPREDGRLPAALAVAHPSIPGAEHAFRDACGALVAWKLAWALLDARCGSPEAHRLPATMRETLAALTALAALGTVADVMPLVGENRAIVRCGIDAMLRATLPGLKALLDYGNLGKDGVQSETIAFRLAPRLNACGRLGSAEAAVRLFTTATPDECAAIVRELDALNGERRTTERRIFEEASRLARERGMDSDRHRAIVLSSPAWHAGVVGIVCARLVETFGRPAILLQEFDDVARGSGRSIRGFSLLDAILSCGEPPLKAGGHEHAAGITLRRDRIEPFIEAFVAHATARLTPDDLIPIIDVDAVACIDELDLRSVKECEQLGPFGRGNPRPRVRLDQAVVTAPPRTMGKAEQHLQLSLRDATGQRFAKAKWWNGRAFAAHVRQGSRIDAVVEPKIDRYLGGESVELEVKDVRASPSVEG